MPPVRLRHPKGVTTLDVDFTKATVQDLQQQIFAATEIPPSQQELKAGYPPHPLTLVPELPIDSLGLKTGEQLVVTQRSSGISHGSGAPPRAAAGGAVASASPAAAMTGLTASQVHDPTSAPVSRATGGAKGGDPEYVVTSQGYLIHRVVPDDNSCLFSSIALAFEQDISKAQSIRQIVADAIRRDPVKWNEAILGSRPREEYIQTILKPSAWGGAIELTILAEHYGTEIDSVDVETGRVDRFEPPPEKDTGNRAVVIYSGIHYDATSVSPMIDAPDEFHQTIWSKGGKGDEGEEDEMLKAAKKLADALRAKRAYTNPATFDLKCQIPRYHATETHRRVEAQRATPDPSTDPDSPPNPESSQGPSKKQKTQSGGRSSKAAARAPKAAAPTGKAPAKGKGKGKATEDSSAGSADAADAEKQPTNKVLPVHIEFAPKAEGAIRIATWNICGLAAASKKVNNDPVDPALTSRFPYRYWSISDKKTYSGTAVLSKIEPLSVDYTLPGHPDPASVKGRIVTLGFASCYLVGTYVVNAGTGLKTLDAKKEWNKHFEVYIRELDKKKPVIWAGDLNVAPTELDLANPKTNWNKTPGYTEAETSAYARILNTSGEEPDAPKFVDVWRQRHPSLRHYTYFSYRFNCREKGIGWRLDMCESPPSLLVVYRREVRGGRVADTHTHTRYLTLSVNPGAMLNCQTTATVDRNPLIRAVVVSERLTERVKMCEIRSEIYGASDHCPVVMELEGPL
ncbi:hypothetical protein BN946_scf184799.g27 [Trametes cinnabarina]|uniref:Multifunctional fusion protein n=1 Tax=Pycnoporus cinnabarinus TaxID=5643 RepID=A0A060S221_PYCCI|nr:hypothetical protein BN946_scf184799.g27 [Trametes cinnabarina]